MTPCFGRVTYGAYGRPPSGFGRRCATMAWICVLRFATTSGCVLYTLTFSNPSKHPFSLLLQVLPSPTHSSPPAPPSPSPPSPRRHRRHRRYLHHRHRHRHHLHHRTLSASSMVALIRPRCAASAQNGLRVARKRDPISRARKRKMRAFTIYFNTSECTKLSCVAIQEAHESSSV